MKLEQLKEAKDLSTSDKRKAIQQGGFSQDVAFSIRSDLEKIIKKQYNSKEWKYNKHFLDQGLQYKGKDIEHANKVINDIIGDLYGYFVDVPKRERVRVTKSRRTVGPHKQEVYVVEPSNNVDSQIEFFKFTEKPELGILINRAKK